VWTVEFLRAAAEERKSLPLDIRAKLTQAAIAERMGTTESAVSRLESGRTRPSTRTLERYAAATGHRLKITMEPL
jgi:transcriptional regulator with XRE-family HTH domain